MRMAPVKRIAVIGAGPAGAMTVDCLAQERAFDIIRVFERREKAGGCWLQDPAHILPQIPDVKALAARSADQALGIPENLPTVAGRSSQYRFAETSVYPSLETNIDAAVMEFSDEPIPETRSSLSIKRHGPDTPFRHHTTIQRYVESLLDRHNYQRFVEYNTTVEKVEKLKDGATWRLTLRRAGVGTLDEFWWTEDFDAVIVANGHYTVPFIPEIEGLTDFMKAYPESVEHSKSYRGVEKYRGKRVVVVGASVSGMDIVVDLIGQAESPINAVVRGRWNPYFGGLAFEHPGVRKRPAIQRFESASGARAVHFEDGTSLENVDHIIFGTGYTWSLPFLPDVPIRNNRVPDLFLHIFKRQDPTLVFIGAVAAGLTFKVYEWQAVLAARFLAGRIQLPSIQVQERWERDRIAYKGDGVPFTALYPDFEEYFETVRKLAGEPTGSQPGRKLPRFDRKWVRTFEAGHQRRKAMWRASNEEARKTISEQLAGRAKL